MNFYERRGTMVYTEPDADSKGAKFVCECKTFHQADDLVDKLNALPSYLQNFDEACDIGGDAIEEYAQVHEVFNVLREICEMKP